jgi:hypothetical protein
MARAALAADTAPHCAWVHGQLFEAWSPVDAFPGYWSSEFMNAVLTQRPKVVH